MNTCTVYILLYNVTEIAPQFSITNTRATQRREYAAMGKCKWRWVSTESVAFSWEAFGSELFDGGSSECSCADLYVCLHHYRTLVVSCKPSWKPQCAIALRPHNVWAHSQLTSIILQIFTSYWKRANIYMYRRQFATHNTERCSNSIPTLLQIWTAEKFSTTLTSVYLETHAHTGLFPKEFKNFRQSWRHTATRDRELETHLKGVKELETHCNVWLLGEIIRSWKQLVTCGNFASEWKQYIRG